MVRWTRAWVLVMNGLPVLLAGCAAPPEQVFSSSRSPGGEYTATVTVTAPWMPYGRYTVTAYVTDEKTGAKEKVAARKLENDGVPFTDKNIALRWVSEHMALVCLRATDLHDEGIRITVRDKPVAEIVKDC